ncbi:hypothetical protein CMU25_18510 [Elizabethkingia anophelis]|nr:hypothetical protein [Elizabethkingia anophelis]MDV3842311.1 hypothetical protein [Elizabethkingia anophelis]
MKPIQQMVIGVEGKNIGAISNDKGIFGINLSNQSLKNNLIITANSYKPYKMSVEDFIKQFNHDIILNERVMEIPEVNISSKRYILKNWGNNINRAYTSFDSNKSNDIKNKTISIDVSKYSIWINSDFYVSKRVADDFKGKLQLGGNVYAFTKDSYYRYFYDNWDKYSMGDAINVDKQINN